MARVLVLKQWQRFQHYKDRDPPWIKLYRDALTSEVWVLGTDLSRLVQLASTLLAARYNNATPYDARLIRKVLNLDCTDSELVDAIEHLAAHEFLEIQEVPDARKPHASTPLSKCSSEAEQSRAEQSREYTERAREKPKPAVVPRETPDAEIFEHPDAEIFEHVAMLKAKYPPGAAREDWIQAERSARRAVESGATWADLHAGVERYARLVKATNRIVLNPANFFGAADRPWSQLWPLPAAKPQTDPAGSQAWERLIASDGAERDARVQVALEAVGGWLAIKARTPFTEQKMRAEFCRAYADAQVAA